MSKAAPADVTAAFLIVEYIVNGDDLLVYNGLSVHAARLSWKTNEEGCLAKALQSLCRSWRRTSDDWNVNEGR